MREAPRAAGLDGLRILVPTDFSASSDAALGVARRLAATVRGAVRLLHVIERPAMGTPFGSELWVPEPPLEEQAATPRVHLSQRMLVDSRSRVKIDSDVIFGPTGAMIAVYAGDNGFDLIVMGTRGRSGLAHLLMGSVAESVIRTAPCPVLTMKSSTAARAPAADAGAAYAAV
jgi:nucleotide-binding universal stress UspA family protein